MSSDLEEIARRVNWYTSPGRTLANRSLFLAQVMARGTTEDVVVVQGHVSTEDLRSAYLQAPPGLFTRRAWTYWGLMLLNDPDRAMPKRFANADDFDWRKGAS
jgi:hypothetical protein